MEGRVKQVSALSGAVLIFMCREHRLDALDLSLTHGSIRAVFQKIAATSLM
jgi:hypothetical protein